MNKSFSRAFLFCAIAFWIAAIGWSQAAAPRGSVTGTVKGSSGPLVGVKVVIKSAATTAYSENVMTDQNGAFSFSEAPAGGVTVTAFDANGRTIASASGTVNPSGPTLTLVLTSS